MSQPTPNPQTPLTLSSLELHRAKVRSAEKLYSKINANEMTPPNADPELAEDFTELYKAFVARGREIITLQEQLEEMRKERDEAQGDAIIKGASIATLRDKLKTADEVDLGNAAIIGKLQGTVITLTNMLELRMQERSTSELVITELRAALKKAKSFEAVCHCGELMSSHDMSCNHGPVELKQPCPNIEARLTALQSRLDGAEVALTATDEHFRKYEARIIAREAELALADGKPYAETAVVPVPSHIVLVRAALTNNGGGKNP